MNRRAIFIALLAALPFIAVFEACALAHTRQVCTFETNSVLYGGSDTNRVAYYYHEDSLNSSSALSSGGSPATQVEVNVYYPFGRMQTASPQAGFQVSRRFTGQVFDAESGLYYYNARFYDPELGRFIQPDDRIPDLRNPQSYNRYSYCLNNPLRYTDPDGHAPVISTLTFDLKTGANSAGYKDHQFGQGYGIGLHNPPDGPLVAVGAAFQVADKAWNAGLDKITPPIDPNRNPYAYAASQTARGMSLAGVETVATAGLGQLAGALGKTASAAVEGGGMVIPQGYLGGPGAMWTGEGRGLWNLTREGADQVMSHPTFGTFYKSSSDGLWWAADNAGHGGSAFKVFQETGSGLKWYRDADQFGDFIVGKYKGPTGQFIPWKQLKSK